MGCEVTKDYAVRLMGTKQHFPILGDGTSQEDFDEALWVMQRQHRTNPTSTTWLDLELYHAGVDPSMIGMEDCDYDDIPQSQLSAGMKDIIVDTKAGEAMKASLKQSQKRKSSGHDENIISDSKKEEARKLFQEEWKSL